jgi:hypothetical protein
MKGVIPSKSCMDVVNIFKEYILKIMEVGWHPLKSYFQQFNNGPWHMHGFSRLFGVIQINKLEYKILNEGNGTHSLRRQSINMSKDIY